MRAPTEKQVKAEIERLTEMKPNVRHHTSFGDDNWGKIEAQIMVLAMERPKPRPRSGAKELVMTRKLIVVESKFAYGDQVKDNINLLV